MKVGQLINALHRYPADYEVDVSLICADLPHSVHAEVHGVDRTSSPGHADRVLIEAATEGTR